MSSPERVDDWTLLDGCEVDIFKLVRAGATSKQWKEWLRVPLEHAAADGNMDLFTRLLDAGADGSPGWRGCYGRTLLGAAAHGKDEKMVLSLLRAGAKPEVNVLFNMEDPDDDDGEIGPTSALHVAAEQGAAGVSKALMVAGADPDQLDGDNQTPLHVAARDGHRLVVDNLILKGANLEAKNHDWHATPLHIAAEHGKVLCVSALLLGGADKNSLDGYRRTPLISAVEEGHLKVAEELMAAGADIDIRDHPSMSALDKAACFGFVEVLRSILAYGGDVHACDAGGRTALHKVQDGAEHIVPVLLEAGADIEAKSTEGMTPLLHAARGFFAARGFCSRWGQHVAIRALLEGGANVDACDNHGSTALHAACLYSSVDSVELLLRWGADETKVNEGGDKPLEMVGKWKADIDDSDLDDEDREANDERKADNQRIRQMLARAPADRSWRRRGWLVLCRSHPTRVQLATDEDNGGNDRSAKVAKASVEDAGDEAIDLGRLVERVVRLDADSLFRLVVGFL